MRRALLLSLALLFLPFCVRGDDLKEIEKKLRADYKGKVLTLRYFNTGRELRFDAEGNLLEGGPPGPWTLNGKIEVTDIKLKEKLEIFGNRLFLTYDQENKKWRHLRSAENVDIRIELKPNLNQGSIQQALSKVFLSGSEELPEAVPSYWKSFLLGKQRGCLAEFGKVQAAPGQVLVKSGVMHARLLNQVAPIYPMVARRARVQGEVVLAAVISEEGKIQDIQIIGPLGMGVDEAAVEAVSQWTYEPTRLDGRPVKVCTSITINFKLR